ncbi:hypothetical protein SCHPADRAFT_698392 [Schizopora paradoxa]|uniref:Uncharacterized protein n=1 Tax=Schizopora paradoxa TaxID=27342 RepID=A0A0H2R320_9AGAM|nr:hypothetical protein SCHPADRAFT_698392 [Schizopora paradoxa]
MDGDSSTSWLSRHSMRLRMILFFVGAVAVMIAHHCFYWYLNKKPVGFEEGLSDVASFIIYYYTSIANLMTIVAKGLIAAILGIVFAQIFWMQVRRRQYDVPQISESLACKDSPISALKTVQSTFMFSAITFLTLSLAVITIFATGSIDFNDTSYSRPCDVQTVNMSNAAIAVFDATGLHYRNPIAQVKGFVGRVLLSGGPLTPVVVFDEYGGNTTYSITFNAPSLNCTDISSTFDFSDVLPDPDDTDDDTIIVWNANTTTADGALVFTVATRELLPGSNFTVTPGDSPEAVSCIPYESTYIAQVSTGYGDDGSSPAVTVKNVTPVVPLSPASASSSDSAEVQHYAIVDAFTSLLSGNASYDPNTFDFVAGSPIVAYSPMGAAYADSPWYWADSMLDALPSLMENVSVSILSDVLSETNFPTLSSTSTTCDYGNVYYVYRPLRLFLSYGAGLLIGAFGIVLGFYAIHANGREESLDFALILRFVTSRGVALAREKKSSEEPVSLSIYNV